MPISLPTLFRSRATTSTEQQETPSTNRLGKRRASGTTPAADSVPTELRGLKPARPRTPDTTGQAPGDADMTRTVEAGPGTDAAFEAAPRAAPNSAGTRRRGSDTSGKKPPTLPEKTTLSERNFMRGFGMTSKTVALTPSHSVTTSAEPNLKSSVRKDGDEPLRASPLLKNGGRPKTAVGAKPGKTLTRLENERARTATDTAVDDLFAEHSRLFASAATHTTTGAATADRPRADMLAELKSTKAANALSTAQVDKLAKTLNLAFKDSATPVRDGIEALQALKNTNLLQTLRSDPHLAGPAPAAQSNAWMLAQRLEAVPGGMGMALLNKLTPSTPRPAGVDATVTAGDRVMLRTFLAASAAVARDAKANGRTVGHDPQSLFTQPDSTLRAAIAAVGTDNWPGRNGAATPPGIPLTDNEKALLAVTDELKALDRHVAATPGQPFAKGTHGCAYAIGVVHNGLTENIGGSKGETAAKKAKGGAVKSEFQWIDAFAEKSFGKHLGRTLKTTQPEKLKGIARMRRALNNHLNVNSNKSAFHAYDSVVSSKGLNRGLVLPHRSPIADGRAFGKMLTTFSNEAERGLREDFAEEPLMDASGKFSAERLMSNEPALRSLVRATIVATTRDQEKMLPDLRHLDARSDFTKETIFKAVRARISDPAEGTTIGTLEDRIKDFIGQDNQPLTAQRILQWAGEIGGPADDAAATRMARAPSANGPTVWHEFAKSFDRVENGAIAPLDTPPLKGMTRHEAANLIRRLVERDELGSGFTLSNGGNVQISTKGVSGAVSNALLGISANVRINLTGGALRVVSFEDFVSADRSGIRIAVSTLKKVEVGAGGSVGHSFDEHTPVTLSAGGDVSYKYQVTNQEGVVYGFARHATGGVGGDEALSLKKGELIQILLDDLPARDPAIPNPDLPGNDEDFSSRTKRALQAFPYELSVGSFEFSQSDHALSAALTGGAGIRFGDFRLGLPAGHVGGEGHRTTSSYRDNSGWLRTERETESLSCKATADLTLATLGGLDPIQGGNVSSKAQLVAGSFATGSVDFYHHSIKDSTTLIVAEGEELSTSFQQRFYGNGQSYLKGISQNVQKASHDKAAKFHGPNEYQKNGEADTDHPAREADVVARVSTRLEHISNRFLEEKDLTATPNYYSEYDQSEVIEKANDWRADRYIAEQNKDKARGKDITRAIWDIHADPVNHQARFVIATKERSTIENKGPNNILGVTAGIQNQVVEHNITFS